MRSSLGRRICLAVWVHGPSTVPTTYLRVNLNILGGLVPVVQTVLARRHDNNSSE